LLVGYDNFVKMTEVVVVCDRKTMFTKSKILSFYQLLLIACAVLVQANLIQPQPFGSQSSNVDGVLKRFGDNQSGSKFSSVLLNNSPFRIPSSDETENAGKVKRLTFFNFQIITLILFSKF